MATYPGGFPTAKEEYGLSMMVGDYAMIAEGMGAKGIRVENPSELKSALEKAMKHNSNGESVLIDVHSNMESKKSRFYKVLLKKNYIEYFFRIWRKNLFAFGTA